MDSDYVEMKGFEDDSQLISKSLLYKLHHQQICNNQTNEINQNQLIVALGGIDNILSHYLSPENHIELSQTQLNSINNILNAPSSDMESNTSYSSILSFNKKDTMLHKILDPLSAQILTNFIQHGRTVSVLVFGAIVLFLWMSITGFLDLFMHQNPKWTLCFVYLLIYSFIVMMMYAVIYLLTANIEGVKLEMSRFLFWFKVTSTLKFIITWLMLYWYFGIFKPHHGVSKLMFIVVQLSCCIVLFLLVVALCIIDSIYMSRRMKILWNIILCLLWTTMTLRHIFYPPIHDTSIIEIGNGLSISILSLEMDTLKVLAIFFWKQAIYLMLNPNKCVNIRKSPYFSWN